MAYWVHNTTASPIVFTGLTLPTTSQSLAAGAVALISMDNRETNIFDDSQLTALRTSGDVNLLYTGAGSGATESTPDTNDASLVISAGTNALIAEINWGGSSFPANPRVGQQWFRTDLGMTCTWDGANWLGPLLRIYFARNDTTTSDNNRFNSVVVTGNGNGGYPLIRAHKVYALEWSARSIENDSTIVLRAHDNSGGGGAYDANLVTVDVSNSTFGSAQVSLTTPSGRLLQLRYNGATIDRPEAWVLAREVIA